MQVSDPYQLGSGKSQTNQQTLMKTFKTFAMIVLVLVGLYDLRAAVVISDLSPTEYTEKLSASTVSWKVEMFSGYPSSSTKEITVTANNTQSVSHLWSIPEQIQLSYDTAGNLIVRAGSTVITTQPLLGFNAVLVQISNLSLFDEVTEFRSWNVEGAVARNLFAVNSTFGIGFDQVLATGVDSNFTLDGSFYKGQFGVDHDSTLTITGIQIPEPSSGIILGLSSLLFYRRRR